MEGRVFRWTARWGNPRMPFRWLTLAQAIAIVLTASAATLALATGPARSDAVYRAPTGVRVPSSAAPLMQAGEQPRRPLIIGHHGAAGHLPANTLASFDLAIREGADYIEPDVVLTSDGVLVARHENNLAYTTDVAWHREFATKRRTKRVNGITMTGWFAEDFTLAQLRTLRVAGGPGTPGTPGGYPIPTLAQIIDLVRADEQRYHRTIGLSIEVKDGAFLDSIRMPIEPRLVALLRANHLDSADSPVLVESTDTTVLANLHRLARVPLVWVIPALPGRAARAAILTALDGVARYASGVAVDGSWLGALLGTGAPPVSAPDDPLPPVAAPAGVGPSPSNAQAADILLREVRRHHMALYVYAFGNQVAQYLAYAALGIDGVFSDDPDVAVRAYG